MHVREGLIMLAWHFLPSHGGLRHDDHGIVEPGSTLCVDSGLLLLCKNGLHACKKVVDALYYAPFDVIPTRSSVKLCRVEMGGRIIEDTDKLVASERTVLWMINGCWEIFNSFAIRALQAVVDECSKLNIRINTEIEGALDFNLKKLLSINVCDLNDSSVAIIDRSLFPTLNTALSFYHQLYKDKGLLLRCGFDGCIDYFLDCEDVAYDRARDAVDYILTSCIEDHLREACLWW